MSALMLRDLEAMDHESRVAAIVSHASREPHPTGERREAPGAGSPRGGQGEARGTRRQVYLHQLRVGQTCEYLNATCLVVAKFADGIMVTHEGGTSQLWPRTVVEIVR